MRCAVLVFLFWGALAGPTQDEALQEFAIGNRRFTAGVYKEILKSQQGNFIASSLSAETVLALTNEGAVGDTSTELITGLSLPNTKEKIQRAFKTFLPTLKTSDDNLKLLSANKIYVAKGLELKEEFRSVASSIYNSGVENVDFTKNLDTSAAINKWVGDNTNGKIRDLVKPDSIDGSTRMILVNALYFQGQWVSPFQPRFTAKKDFFSTQASPSEVDTMQQTDYFNYYQNPSLNAKFLELPYQGADISMVIILPNEIEGLVSLEQNIEQLLIPQPYTKERVRVELPKFTIESEIKFIPILKSLGINKIFTRESDLSGLTAADEDLYVSDVIQKAFINVTESGTEAAAATSVGVALLSAPIAPPPPVLFRANHPFTYYIKDNRSGVIIFFGRYHGK